MVQWELIIAICGLLIALSTAITTIWQGFLSRKYYRLSVRPLLNLESQIIKDEKASLILKNSGIGPALIKKVNFFYCGNSINELSTSELASRIELSEPGINVHRLFEGDCLYTGYEHYLIETQTNVSNDELRENIEEVFNNINFEILYESIYGEKFKLDDKHNVVR